MTISEQITQTAAGSGVDPNLAMQVAHAESGLNQNAISSAGAIGVFQLMPATAAGLGVDPSNVSENIQGGVSYLGSLLQKYGGDTAAALAAYYWGPSNVDKAMAASPSDWLSNIPSSVYNYVAGILGSLGPSSSAAAASSFTVDPATGDLVPADSGLTASPTFWVMAALAALAVWAVWRSL